MSKEHTIDGEQQIDRINGGGNNPSSFKFPLVQFHDIHIDTSQCRYLIKNLLASTGLTVIWGPPKCGKGFSAMDMGLHIALGWDYRGYRVQQAPVVYIALEGHKGFPARIDAFRQHHDIREKPPFYLITVRLDLIADANVLIADIKTQLGAVIPGAVFIDTLNRSLVGSESKDEDMARYLAAAEKIEQQFNCNVIVIHHSGVDASRPRGHTSLSGSVESQLAVTKEEAGIVTVRVEYAKDFAEGAEIVSRLEVVNVGTDIDGDPITSLIVIPVTTSTKTAKANQRKKLPKGTKLALDILREAILEAGEPAPPSGHIPQDVKVIKIDTWRLYFKQRTITDSDKPDSIKHAFSRASEKLQEANLVGILGDYAWLLR